MINLLDYRKNITSHHGENGMILTLIDKLNLKNGLALEVGAYDGVVRSNICPLRDMEWNLLYIEGDNDNYKQLKENMINYSNVICECSFINLIEGTRLDDIIRKHWSDKEVDIISLDIDGNDYWIWESMEINPRLMIIEFNRDLGESVAMKYKEGFKYVGGKVWGSSALALTKLAKKKGYDLIGIRKDTLFFIKKELNQGAFFIYNPKMAATYSENCTPRRLTDAEKELYVYV
jgi:hypothetical protein